MKNTKTNKIKGEKVLKYKEYYKKYFGKVTAAEILFGWFDYCQKYGIKDTYNADKEVEELNKELLI